MFNPKTKKIEKISELHQPEIDQLESFFTGDVGVYIDYANVRPWSVKLNWNIDLKRLKQFLDSFDNIKSVKFYDGTLKGDKDSEKSAELKKRIFKDGFKTKLVKIIHQSIDCTSIKSNSPDLLDKFIRRCLLRKYNLETVEYLNLKFKEMNENGIYFIAKELNNLREAGLEIFDIKKIREFICWKKQI